MKATHYTAFMIESGITESGAGRGARGGLRERSEIKGRHDESDNVVKNVRWLREREREREMVGGRQGGSPISQSTYVPFNSTNCSVEQCPFVECSLIHTLWAANRPETHE